MALILSVFLENMMSKQLIFCVETNNINSNQVQKREFYDIKKYCQDKGYSLVWFNLGIEDVFYGHRVEKKDKTKEAAKFRSRHLIKNVKEVDFKKKKETQHGSNLALVLDELLERKE